MSSSMKNYNKALKKFQSGEIGKALEFVEEAVALDISNKAALNLKGMILYLKGNLHGAEASWNVNVKINKDSMAITHLENIQDDIEKENLYKESLNNIKTFDLDNAIYLLEKAKESDFNAINVNNALAYCYIKIGEKEKAKECVDKVLSIDKSNNIALDYVKELKNGKRSYKNIMSKKATLASSVAVGLLVVGGVVLLNNSNSVSMKIDNEIDKKVVVKEETEVGEEKKEDKKDYDLKELIESSDYEQLDLAFKENREVISLENQENYEKGKELLQTKGVKYFYDKGLNEFKNGEFGKANIEFQKGFQYAKGSYLAEHLNYMIAVSYEKLNDMTNAIKYYEEYYDSFKKGEYTEEVLYKLTLLNKDVNKAKSKKYGERLIYDFKNSIYNNNNIKSILKEE